MSTPTDKNTTLAKFIANFKCNCKSNHSNHEQHLKCKRKLSAECETPEKKSRLSSQNGDTPSASLTTSTTSNISTTSVLSPWESRRLKTELVESRSRIVMLENQIQQLHAVRKKLEIVFENEKQVLQDQHTQDRNKITDLESRIKVLRERESETKSELMEALHKLEVNKLNYESKIEELQRTIDRLKDELLDTSSSEQENALLANQRILELEDALSAAEDDNAAQKQIISDLQAQLAEANSAQQQLELKEQALQRALLKIKELEYEKGNYLEWQQQVKVHQSRLSNYNKLEKEVKTLREENKNLHDAIQNKLLLEEQVLDLQKQLELNKNLQNEVVEFQVKYSHVEAQLNEWYTLARDLCESSEPDCVLIQQMKKTFENFQQKEIILTSEKSNLETENRALQREVSNRKQEIEKCYSQINDLQTLQKSHQTLIHRLQKKLLLVSRERDSYRQQLDSYEKELTLTLGPGSGDSGQAMVVQALRERCENSDRILEGYRELIAKLEADLEAGTSGQNQNVAPVRTEQVKRLQTEIAQLRAENERILQQRSNLEKELEHCALQDSAEKIKRLETEIERLKTEMNTVLNENVELKKELEQKKKDGEKILHFQLNPLSEATSKYKSEVAALKCEIDRLKKKIHNLEQGVEQTTTSESTFISQSQELQSLREQLKSSELKVQRLKEVFVATSQEFREVCYNLLGYKIDRVNNTNYRLISLYSESPNDYLSFQMTDDRWGLVKTPFSSTLEDLIELHFGQSIPVFLSAVTMKLYEQSQQSQIVSS